MRIIKGPLPPSVFYPISKTADDTSSQVKVKRKCGRPRNPIPRHKRESHINAEHRRRGKIQDGFRTLKGIVPKYEQSSGRDSKADILFKGVDYCRLLQNDIKELGSSIEALKAEKDALSVDIKNYKTAVPDLSLYDGLSVSLDDRYTDYVQSKSKENWTFGTFKVIMRPLFESYKLCVRGESWGDFLRSVADWAATSLSLSNLRTVCLTTLRDVPTGFGDVDQFKDGPRISSFGATSPAAKSIVSDNNNNDRCLDGQSLASELFDCENIAANPARAGWNLPAADEVHIDAFETSNVVTNTESPLSKKGAYLNMQHSEDLASFAGGHLDSSGIFGELYYNLGSDLHHHQLNLARATMNNWPNLHFRQQHGHYYQNSHLFPSRNCPDFREGSHFWGSQHQQLSQHLVGDHSLAPGHYQQQTYPLPDRDFRYDVSNPREGLETLPSAVPYLCHSTNFHHPDHSRRKRLSQSSSESEGSLLNMDMFARKATETMCENEKYPQLSPSTDSCVSSGSSAYIQSPGVLNGRSADYVCPYRSVSSLDNFKQTRAVAQERLDSFDSQLSLPVSTYRDIFGVRAAEHHTNYANRLDEQQKTCVNRYDDDARPLLCGNSSKTVSATDCRQPSSASARHDSSSLLAEMLGQQQSALLHTWSANHCMDVLPPAPTHHTKPALHMLTVTSANPHNAGDFVNELVKKESAHLLASLSPGQSPDNLYAIAKDQHSPLSVKGQSFHSQTLKNSLTLDMKNAGMSNSSWLYPYAKSQTTPDFTASTKLKLERNQLLTGSPSQAGYFDMTHQKLLKNHCYSINSKDTEVQMPDLVSPQKESCPIPKQETDIYNCEMSHVSNNQTAMSARAETSTFLEKSSQLILQSRESSSFKEASTRQKIARKSPFEIGSQEDGQLEAVSAFKKTCQRQEFVKTSSRLMTRQYGDSESVSGI
ncbi:hypothetical protein BsWGS_12584 [Bradybaena similaris]